VTGLWAGELGSTGGYRQAGALAEMRRKQEHKGGLGRIIVGTAIVINILEDVERVLRASWGDVEGAARVTELVEEAQGEDRVATAGQEHQERRTGRHRRGRQRGAHPLDDVAEAGHVRSPELREAPGVGRAELDVPGVKRLSAVVVARGPRRLDRSPQLLEAVLEAEAQLLLARCLRATPE